MRALQQRAGRGCTVHAAVARGVSPRPAAPVKHGQSQVGDATPAWRATLGATAHTAAQRGVVAVRAEVDDASAESSGEDGKAAPRERVFVSRARKDGQAPPPPPSAPRSPPPDGEGASAAAAAPAAPREFGRFTRGADGNFARPGGAPVQPGGGGERPPPRGGGFDGGGFRGGPAPGRFAAPSGGRGGPAGPGAGRGAGRDGDKEKGRRGRVDDGPVSGRAATEARRNARATRKEERSNKAQKKERVEFLEVPAQGMGLEELAEKLAVNSADVIKALFMKGIMTTVNMVRAHAHAA
jgi:translation initiation factor IF-2